jgi:hypothetical protein
MVVAASAKQKKEPQPFFFELSRLMVVGITMADNQLVYKTQTEPNGPWEANWTPIAKSAAYDIMAAGSTRDGSVAVVAQTHSNPNVHYYVNHPDSSSGIKGWVPPVDLGLPPGLAGFGLLAMARDLDGRVEVFGLTEKSGDVWWIYQNPDRVVEKQVTRTPPGTTTPVTVTVQERAPPLTPWSQWQQLAPSKLDVLTLANNRDGRIALLGSARNNHQSQVWYCQQESAQALTPKRWTAWVQLTQPNESVNWPVLHLDPAGPLNVFAVSNSTNNVVQRRQTEPGSVSFGPWISPEMTGRTLVTVVAGTDADDRLVLLAADEHRVLIQNILLDAVDQKWSGWQEIGVLPGLGPLTLDYNADGRLTLFVREGTSPNNIYCLSQAAPDSTAWEANWTQLSTKGLAHYGVAHDLTPPAMA